MCVLVDWYERINQLCMPFWPVAPENPHQEADVALVHEMCLLSAAAVCGPKMLGLRIEFLLSLPGLTPKCQDFQANSKLHIIL